MTNFKQLLFRAGFMNFGKLDRRAVMEFLFINSERTLERWIKDNKPCPRAVAMLEQRIKGMVSMHKDWKEFSICRDGYLWTPSGNRYEPSYINKIDFLQRSVRYNENHVLALQQQIDHLNDLVKASDTLKAIGHDLINMSDQFKLKDIVIKYGDKKMA
ncbi:hypothetical protein AMS57_02110 [Pseudoalteromonas undina]|uniref:hypothetical protein n=1 Tax=Pseudoalteromonas undina TaxID=43660 RepID=UPI0006BB17E4|nr:hypothetical protein [Pseudoalteromonas undina]KPH92342.1 hypothetical protein AMS57_02110 [Pseudoalteromonas undina]